MLDQSVVAIIVMAVTVVAFVHPKTSIALTALVSVSVFSALGIISFSDAFAGFSSTPVLLTAGYMIMGEACFASGLGGVVGRFVLRFARHGERAFLAILMVVVSLLSLFVSPTLVTILFLAVVDGAVAASNGRLQRKYLYIPVPIASVYGNVTTVGSSSLLVALGSYTALGYEMPGLFDLAPIKLPALVCVIVCYVLFGLSLSHKVFTFEENEGLSESETNLGDATKFTGKMAICVLTILGTLVAMALGADKAWSAVVGAVIVIATGCIDEQKAFQGINWATIVLVGCSAGMSSAMDQSGAGALLADTVISVSESVFDSPYALCVIVLVVTAVISNFMSDSGAAAIMAPIAMALCVSLGLDPLPFAFAVACGAVSAIGTPISVLDMTLTYRLGYRFTDYLKVPLLFNVICVVVEAVMFKVVFF